MEALLFYLFSQRHLFLVSRKHQFSHGSLAAIKAQADGGDLNLVVVGLIAALALAPLSNMDVLSRLLVCGHGLDRKKELSTSAGSGSLSSVKYY